VKLSDGSIRNTYTLKIVNKTHEDQHFALKVDGLETQGITVIGAGQLTADNLRVLANSVATFRIMLSAERPKEARRDITLQLENENPKLSASNETVFMSEGSR
jgi:polyferredoxin